MPSGAIRLDARSPSQQLGHPGIQSTTRRLRFPPHVSFRSCEYVLCHVKIYEIFAWSRAWRLIRVLSACHGGTMPESNGAHPLDETSKTIIEILQRDGRTPYSTIARDVGLSEGAVRQRVARLVEGGLLQIVAVTDPIKMGFQRQALIGIVVSGDVRVVSAEIGELPEVIYVVITAGRFDLLVEVVCENDAHLLELLMSRIRRIEGVRETETFMYLELATQRYDWGTR